MNELIYDIEGHNVRVTYDNDLNVIKYELEKWINGKCRLRLINLYSHNNECNTLAKLKEQVIRMKIADAIFDQAVGNCEIQNFNYMEFIYG